MERIWKCAAAAAAVLMVTQGAALAADAPAKASKAKATHAGSVSLATLGGHPNLNGVWQVMNTADWDLRPHDAAQAPAGAFAEEPASQSAEEQVADGGAWAAPDELPDAAPQPWIARQPGAQGLARRVPRLSQQLRYRYLARPR